MDETRFVSKTKKSIFYQIAFTLVLLYAIFWMQVFFFGRIALGMGALLLIGYTDGFDIDFKGKKYRKTKYLGPMAFGKWIDLPEVKYISVFRVIITSGVRGLSNTRVSSQEKVIVINLIYDKNKRLRVYKTEDKNDAFEKAGLISKGLGLRIYDATEREGKWLDE